MQTLAAPRESLLPQPVVHMTVDDPQCDFDCAMQAAKNKAEAYDNAPRLLSWFDRNGLACFPGGDIGTGEEKPGWVTHAESMGANLTISVNEGDYIFIFRKSHGLP